MFRPLPLAIGLRYFRSGRRDRFLSLVSWISLLGMTIGVTSLIVVLSVMNGFEGELRQRVLSLIPHGFVQGPDDRLRDWPRWVERAEQHPGVRGATPWVGGNAMLASRVGMRAIDLYAVAPGREHGLSEVQEQLIAGRYLSEGGNYDIVLGEALVRRLGVDLGDTVSLVLPRVTVSPMGLFPRERDFQVVGIFRAGTQLDGSTAFIHLADGQRLYQLDDDVQGLRIYLHDLFQAPRILPEIAELLPEGSTSSDWSRSQGSLFQAVEMEKRMVSVLLFFVVLIAVFNIISILTMAVSEKRAAIAVLRTMGAQPRTILWIFVVFGMSTGVLGVSLGVVFGVLLASYLGPLVSQVEEMFGAAVFSPDVYFITDIPTRLLWGDVVAIAGLALLLSLLATLYPAWQASRVQPAEALRYE